MLRLEKSRTRDPHATDYRTYHLFDVKTNMLASYAFQGGYGLGLDDVARVLFGDNTIHVCPRNDEDADRNSVNQWLDVHNPSREPWIEYRKTNTTGARFRGKLLDDGWVLFYDDGAEEYILGAWDGAENACLAARKFLDRWGRRSGVNYTWRWRGCCLLQKTTGSERNSENIESVDEWK